MKLLFARLVLLTALCGAMVLSCRKTPEPVVPTPPAPTPLVADPRPVEGNYQFFFTDPTRSLGVSRRYPNAKLDVAAFGPKTAEGYLTEITGLFLFNPNTQDWVQVSFAKGFPTQFVTSKGYTVDFKNYDPIAKTVAVTISQNGQVVEQRSGSPLPDSFFQSVAQYDKARPRARGAAMSSCEQAKAVSDALGWAANAVGCAGGLSTGGLALIGSGAAVLSSCFGALDTAFGWATGKSITERALGPTWATRYKILNDIAGFGLPGSAGAAAFMKNFNDLVGLVNTGSDLVGAIPCSEENPGHSTGDPHLTTLDGLNYDFQGHGEFIALKATTDNFEVQVRQEDVKGSGLITMNTAVGIQTGSDVVCVMANPDRLFINGQVKNLDAFTSQVLTDGAFVVKSRENGWNTLNVYHKNGDLVKVRFQGSYLLDYSIYPMQSRKGQVTGLLGDYDGSPTNDVRVRDGTVLSGTLRLNFKDLYPAFANSWRISQAASLFFYDAGKTTESYTQRNFPEAAAVLSAGQRATAEAICRAAGVTEEPFLSGCILDVALTGDPALTGSSLWGQQADPRPASLPIPIIPEASNVKALKNQDNGTFLLKDDGTLWVSGWNSKGQFGVGKTFQEFDSKARFVPVMEGIKDIATGGTSASHVLLLKTDNTVWAAGYNSYGQIGNGATDGNNVLAAVQVMTDARAVVVGTYQSFVVKTDNSLWAFGHNHTGQLGDGTKTDRFRPVKIMDNVASVAAGYYHTLVLKTDNSLWGMGSALFGGLGLAQNSADVLVPVKLMDNVVALAAGDEHSLVLKTDQTIWVTGGAARGQLGTGQDASDQVYNQYGFTKLLDKVQRVSAGSHYSLFLKTDNTLWGTGDNRQGQLGDGTKTDRKMPVQLLSGVKYMVAGGGSTFVVKTDGTLWAAGQNLAGELGDGTTVERLTFVPINVK